MNIEKINSVDDLRTLGTVEEISKNIRNIITPLIISSTSYEDLFSCIQCLKKNWIPFQDGYFKSKRLEYIYYILEHEGEKREKLLGINDDIYSDPKKAKVWFKKITQIIRADLADFDDATKAFQKLQEIFHDITDENAFGDVDE